MICKRCGAQSDGKSAFCPECGAALLQADDKTVAAPDATMRADFEATQAAYGEEKTVAARDYADEATVIAGGGADIDRTVAAPVVTMHNVEQPKNKKTLLIIVMVAAVIIALLAGIFIKKTIEVRTEKHSKSEVESSAEDSVSANGENLSWVENMTYIDSEGNVYSYSPENMNGNTSAVFAYVQTCLSKLEGADGGVKISLTKDIVKLKDANGKEKPYSDNDTLNALINTLSKNMLITEPVVESSGSDNYVDMDITGQIVVFDGESAYGEAKLDEVIRIEHIQNLNRDNIKMASSVDEGSFRILTVTLQDSLSPETVKNLYNQGNEFGTIKNMVFAELEKAKDFIRIVNPENTGVKYDNCQLIFVINLETDEIVSVEYVKRANITATVVGAGTLSGLNETPVAFCYESVLKYDIDRVKPDGLSSADKKESITFVS